MSSASHRRIGISALYDLALDIKHYQGDREFAASGGRIYYVFDENVFETFVYPNKNSVRAESFVLDPPTANDSLRGGERRARKIAAKQAALFAAEALFATVLPGQHEERIYLTQWHRDELLDRMGTIVRNYSKTDLEQFKLAAETLLTAKFEVWKKEKNDRYTRNFRSDDLSLPADAARLREDPRVDPETLMSFCRNREAALALAEDEIVEPAQQLARILAPEMQSRLKALKTLGNPRTSNERPVFADEAAAWARAIQAEVRLRQEHTPEAFSRPKRSLLNDGRSLAHLEWVAGGLDPRRERLVFVTGDHVLRDAYRRRFEDVTDSGVARPRYLLRRITQFTPNFTQNVRTPLVEEHERLFESIRNAAELAVVQVRMEAMSQPTIPSDFARRQQSLTLSNISARDEPHSKLLDTVWRETCSEEEVVRIEAIESQWLEAERTMVGLSREQLLNRMSTKEIALYERLAGVWGAEQLRLFSDYLETSIETLSILALDIWKPIAKIFLKTTLPERLAENYRKLPLAITLQWETADARTVDLIELFERNSMPDVDAQVQEGAVADGSTAHEVAVTSSFDIFAVACSLALAARQWGTADQYSSMAISAYAYLSKHERTTEENAAEAYYLAALAKRFQLGELDVDRSYRKFAAAQELFEDAVEALSYSERLGLNVQGRKEREPVQIFRAFRVPTERAMLNLSFCNVCYAQSKIADLATDRGGLTYLEAAVVAHDQVELYLHEALAVHTDLAALFSENSALGRAGNALKRQFLVAIAGWYVLRRLLVDQHRPELETSDLSALCIREAQALARILERDEDHVALAVLRAFCISFGIDEEESLTHLQRLIADRRPVGASPIERRIMSWIGKEWVE